MAFRYLRQSIEQYVSMYAEGPAVNSVTVSVYDPTGTAIISAQSATNGTASTTLSSAATARDQSISVTSLTGFDRLETYYVGGDSEAAVDFFVVDGKGTGSTLNLVEPLRYDHASGATVRSPKWYYTLSSANLATLGVHRVDWTYDDADGVPIYRSDVFEVVARPLHIPATAADLLVEIPENIRRGADLPAELVIQRGREMVIADFRKRGLKPDLVRDASALVPVLMSACALMLGKRWARNDPDMGQVIRDQAAMDYEAEWERVMAGGLAWYDRDADGVPDDSEVGGVADYTPLQLRRTREFV